MDPSKVELVGFEVQRRPPLDRFAIGAQQLNAQGPCGHPRDLRLDREDVVELSIVALRPAVLLRRHVDELHGDSDPVSYLPNAALQDRPDPQLLADLSDRFGCRAVLGHGRSGDHPEPADLRADRDQFLRQAVGEVLVPGVRADIGKRKDGEAGRGGGREGRHDAVPWEDHTVEVDRSPDSLESPGRELFQRVGHLIPNLVEHLLRDADPTPVGIRNNSRGDVHRVPEDVPAPPLHIPHVNPDSQLKRGADGARGTLAQLSLDVYGALRGSESAFELHEESIPCRFDLPAPVRWKQRSDQLFLLSQPGQGRRFIGLGRGRETGQVGEHDGSEPTRLDHGPRVGRDRLSAPMEPKGFRPKDRPTDRRSPGSAR